MSAAGPFRVRPPCRGRQAAMRDDARRRSKTFRPARRSGIASGATRRPARRAAFVLARSATTAPPRLCASARSVFERRRPLAHNFCVMPWNMQGSFYTIYMFYTANNPSKLSSFTFPCAARAAG